MSGSSGRRQGRRASSSAQIRDLGDVMDYLRRLQAEQPAIFWILMALGLLLGFHLVISLASLLLGPLGLPSWVPLLVVVGGLVLIARAQDKSR